MENVPWQVYVGIIVFVIIVFLVIVIVAISKNKNMTANAEVKNNKFGFSVTDGEHHNKNDKKIVVALTKEQNTSVMLTHLSILTTHPVFTSIFNYILYKSDELVDVQKKFITEHLCSSKKEKVIRDNINKYMLISNTLLKNYITSFKSTLLKIIDDAELDIKNEDYSFSNTLKSFENFTNDVCGTELLDATIDNFKCVGMKANGTSIDPDTVPQEVYDIFKKHIKNNSSMFYRDIIICKNLIFSIDSNLYKRYTYFTNGLTQLFNSVLQYILTLFSEIKYKIFMDLYCKYENPNKEENLAELDPANDEGGD